jgi:hypothetical protein
MKLDDVFQKSNLDENKKKSKMIFGRLLISLRKNNYIKLYALLESVNDTNIVDNVLQLTLSDKTSFDMINNKNDIKSLNEELNKIENLTIELFCNGKEPFDLFKFEQFLKDEFGKTLTIKRKESKY